MKKIDSKFKKIRTYINEKTNNNPDYIFKTVGFSKYDIHAIFCESLVSRDIINHYILEFFEEKNVMKIKTDDILTYLEESLPTHNIKRVKYYEEMMYYLYSGFTIIAVNGYKEVLVAETKAILNSTISPSKNEKVLKGPTDSFTENYQLNLGLIRKRLKTDKLCLQEVDVGELSKTKVGILHISDIASNEIVEYIKEKIANIEIDVVLDSNYILDTINGNIDNFFPTYLPTERPDLVIAKLVQGKIIILVENSQLVTVLPVTFLELFHNPEDYYQTPINANYTRIIRIIAFLITVLMPAIYIAMIDYNHETIPTNLLINFSTQRDGVPLPSILEAILMLLTFEILRETDARIPTIIGSSLSIVGALVLGEAAVTAGVVSPIMVIVIAITSISGFILSYFDVSTAIRWWRLIFLIFAAFAGMIGVIIVGLLFIINLSGTQVLGVPYLSPITPLYVKNLTDSVFVSKKSKFVKRSSLFSKKNIIRGKEKGK